MRKNLKRREQVLDLLYKKEGAYLSGEELSNKLGVSRTSIWKYINYLRDAGYKIESSSKLGYRLITSPGDLLPEEIKRNLDTEVIGQDVIYYNHIDHSTNDEAKKLAQGGKIQGTIILAEEQSNGKGRLGRVFSSPKGGIWLSCILRPDIKPIFATRATYIASLAVAKTINQITSLEAKIKWPNDILIGDKKVSGILTEMSAEIDRVNYLILGIGINLNFSLKELDSELHKKVTTIYEELGNKVDTGYFLKILLEELDLAYSKFDDFSTILDEWKEHSYTLGKKVEVKGVKESFVGEAIDIEADGALLVKIDGEERKFYSGEVSLFHQNLQSGN